MRELSVWAHRHVWQARMVMVISWVMLTCLAVYIGTSLKDLGQEPAPFVGYGLVALLLLTALGYPLRRFRQQLKGVVFYRWQKTCDLLLAIFSFGLMIYAANQPDRLFRYSTSLYGAEKIVSSLPMRPASGVIPSDRVVSEPQNGREIKKLSREERKQLRQEIKAIKASREFTKTEKVLLIVLAALVAAGLLVLVAGLACNLSCNGSEGAAIAVAIAGTALVAFLLVRVIRSILGKQKRQVAASTG